MSSMNVLFVLEAVLFSVAAGVLCFTEYERLGMALGACWLVALVVLLVALVSRYVRDR